MPFDFTFIGDLSPHPDYPIRVYLGTGIQAKHPEDLAHFPFSTIVNCSEHSFGFTSKRDCGVKYHAKDGVGHRYVEPLWDINDYRRRSFTSDLEGFQILDPAGSYVRNICERPIKFLYLPVYDTKNIEDSNIESVVKRLIDVKFFKESYGDDDRLEFVRQFIRRFGHDICFHAPLTIEGCTTHSWVAALFAQTLTYKFVFEDGFMFCNSGLTIYPGCRAFRLGSFYYWNYYNDFVDFGKTNGFYSGYCSK